MRAISSSEVAIITLCRRRRTTLEPCYFFPPLPVNVLPPRPV